LAVIELEDRTLLSGGPPSLANGLAQATPIPVASDGSTTETGHFAGSGDSDFFQIDTPSDGFLVARVHPDLMTVRLSLLDSQGRLLMQSDGLSATDPDDLIEMHLPAGSYVLEVQATGGAGDYALTTSLTPAYDPFQQLGEDSVYNEPIAVGDFNSDGIPDLATPNVIYLGVGDGTFQPPQVDYSDSSDIASLISGDFNGDGRLDLAATHYGSDTISVWLGNGDGSFQEPENYPTGKSAQALVAGDFNDDGRVDLAVANSLSNDISLLLGNGDGTFTEGARFSVGTGPTSIVAGDFNGDGHLDLAVTNSGSGNISVLLGDGDGSFQPQQPYVTGSGPQSVVAGDFNDDGRVDLAVANLNSDTISMLLGRGDGTFEPQVTYAAGDGPSSLVAGDFDGDGRLDLAVANLNSNDVSVFLGNGDGTLGTPRRFAVGDIPAYLGLADFNGDGRPDLVAANGGSNNISVLLGAGDGTFYGQAPDQAITGAIFADSSVVGDFNGDGRLDLAVAHASSDDVSVMLGDGDGTFQAGTRSPVGIGPASLVAGDFNNDGRLDLAVANQGSDTISVLLGNGDGTFRPADTYAVGTEPDFVVAGDFNGDKYLDLAVANYRDGTVTVLLGVGDGTFELQGTYPVGSLTNGLVVGDFNGDGRLDLAAANEGDDTVTVLLGAGDGTFQPRQPIAVGGDPWSLVPGDFNGDGRTDLAVVIWGSTEISLLLAKGDGTFQEPIALDAGNVSGSAVAGDFNGDGHLDLATISYANDPISVLLGNGDGTFRAPEQFGMDPFPESLAAGDFNGDGRLDLAASSPDPNTDPVLLGEGDGTFTTASQSATAPDTTPLVADLNGDGIEDALAIDAAGDILYRQGQARGSTSFAPPVTINPGLPSRDIALLPQADRGPLIASVDARDDRISFFAWDDGRFVRLEGSLATGQLPAQILSADLNGDGRADLVVRNAGDGTLSVFLGAAFNPSEFVGPYNPRFLPPIFVAPIILATGPGVSDVEAVDTTGSGRPDLVITDQVTGQVSILPNQGDGTFGSPAIYRGGAGISSVDDSGESPRVLSMEDTAGLAAGPLTAGGPTDLVTINPASNSIDLLAGLGQGRFANPVPLPTWDPARVIRIADLNHDGIPDLAILTADGVDIELGAGRGQFLPPVAYEAGPDPGGLTIADINQDGNPDLLVSNPFGDLLVLLGRGNGTFQPYRSTNQVVTLAVADLTGDGSQDIILADPDLDNVVVDYGANGSTVVADRSAGLLDPGAVTLADLNDDGLPDLIVANSGSNNVLIYPGLPNGQFAPAVNGGQGYFVGTNPAGITVADLTGATLPDGKPQLDLIVANKGSNDISILLNQGDFRFTPGERLRPGGFGPVSTLVGSFTGDAYPDLLVTESGSNDVRLLPGVGQGFFNDTHPTIFAVGTNPMLSFTGNFDRQTDLVTVNAGSNDLTLISGFDGLDPITTTIPSGGTEPLSAFVFSSGSGFDNLVVGNAGDGALALFEGGTEGLVLTSRATVRDLPNPSDLSFSALTGGEVLFYAATEGEEHPLLVGLSLIGNVASPVPVPPLNDVVQLVPLPESSSALVGTLLTLTIEQPASEINSISIEAPTISNGASVLGPAISVGQSLAQLGGSEIEQGSKEAMADPENPGAGLNPSESSARERFILGLDEALEQFGREKRERFSSSPDTPLGTDPPANGPGAPASSPEKPSGHLQGPGDRKGGPQPDLPQGPRQTGGVEAIDSLLNTPGEDATSADRRNPLLRPGSDAPPAASPLDPTRAKTHPPRFASGRPVPARTMISGACAAALLVATWSYLGSSGGINRFRGRFTAPCHGRRDKAIGEGPT
jgi:hypothetical protein